MAAINPNFNFHFSKFTSISAPNPIPTSLILPKLYKLRTPHAISNSSDPQPNPNPNSNPNSNSNSSPVNPKNEDFPVTKPRKPRRGRKSEAVAVEDFIRDTIEKTFASIREQNPELVIDMENIIKEKVDDGKTGVGEDKGEEDIVEEEKSDWPLDTEVGWGIRASDYFEKYPIKNVVGEDGVEIDWEGEMYDTFVKEINCLEWEKFAFHPSPLIVLVFERYKRASDNWKALTELEKAATVYWEAKDRLPPRTVKIDINIETDLAYALKVKETPQILFLRGNRILHREQQIRTSDELVEMIAHFYYKARKPSFMKVAT